MRSNRFKVILFSCILIGTAIFLITQTQTEAPGKTLYNTHCASCHMADGMGLQGIIPPLAKADYLNLYRDSLVSILKNGMHDSIQVNGKWYADSMPGFQHLHPIEITNILNFIGTEWGNTVPKFTVQEVKGKL